MLFSIILVYFKIPQRIAASDINLTFLRSLQAVTAFSIVVVVFDPLLRSILKEKIANIITSIGVVFILAAPVFWGVVVYSEFNWLLAVVVGVNMFMITVMWNHAQHGVIQLWT